MCENNPKIVDSVLLTKAVGAAQDVSADLQLPQGQSISELLEKNEKEETNNK